MTIELLFLSMFFIAGALFGFALMACVSIIQIAKLQAELKELRKESLQDKQGADSK